MKKFWRVFSFAFGGQHDIPTCVFSNNPKPKVKRPFLLHCKLLKFHFVMRVTVTGAAGQIAYCLLPLLARGDVFGYEQPIELVLLDIEQAQTSLQGVAMELEDGAYPLLTAIHCTSDVNKAFVEADFAILLGAFPRKLGMERRDLLVKNAAIFKEQGEAIRKHAKEHIRILVVGNPANTNAAVLAQYASNIDKKQITALSRLDQNRATSFVAKKLKISPEEVKNVFVWGNHSNTQYPDLFNGVTNRGKAQFIGTLAYLLQYGIHMQ